MQSDQQPITVELNRDDLAKEVLKTMRDQVKSSLELQTTHDLITELQSRCTAMILLCQEQNGKDWQARRGSILHQIGMANYMHDLVGVDYGRMVAVNTGEVEDDE